MMQVAEMISILILFFLPRFPLVPDTFEIERKLSRCPFMGRTGGITGNSLPSQVLLPLFITLTLSPATVFVNPATELQKAVEIADLSVLF